MCTWPELWRADLAGIARAVPGAAISVIRLHATWPILRERIARRELGSGQDWHLQHAADVLRRWTEAPVEDHLVDTTGRSVREIAEEVVRLSQWLDARPEVLETPDGP